MLAWRKTTRERLFSQFSFPTGFAVFTLLLLGFFVPRTLVLTPLWSDSVRLPVSFVNFGLVAFTIASIAQEFYRGMRVRMRQTRGAAVTSLIGLVLSKRRKYGGYVVHLGVAIMFLGWAGKAYESMEDFTVTGPKQTFALRGYTFTYNDLLITSDEHRREVTADVTLTDRSGAELDRMYPAKWFFTKSDQPTSEVAIKSKLITEDIYLILTGYRESTKTANFRVYINPLINWFWLGFAFLTLGVALCLIPQSWVDVSSKRPGWARSAAEGLVLIAILGGITFAFVKVAGAQPVNTAPQLQYSDAPKHGDGAGYAHEFRPSSPTAEKAMKELVCLCGGCQRESVHECRCGYAATERRRVEQLLAQYDVAADKVDPKAYQAVLDAFVAQYGERVLATPQSKWSWAMPIAAVCGALMVLFGFGRRWVGRGQDLVSQSQTAVQQEDEEYADILDDELRDID